MPNRVQVQKENKELSAVSQAGNIILVTNCLFKIPYHYHSNNRIELHSHSFIHFYCLIPASKNANLTPPSTLVLDTVQDFLIKLGIKPHIHLLEIGIFLLYHVIIEPTKIMNRADKNWAHF